MGRIPQVITLKPSEASVSHDEAVRRVGQATEILRRIAERLEDTPDQCFGHGTDAAMKFIIHKPESPMAWKSVFWKFVG
ncbi:MAG: hypothetical protein ABIY70_27030 [Capsulimonas sp.]|uniref:hypothetical protein n=1 Tax=Capsulimonas sp. TaxID=2494211 RepID=UPI003265905B